MRYTEKQCYTVAEYCAQVAVRKFEDVFLILITARKNIIAQHKISRTKLAIHLPLAPFRLKIPISGKRNLLNHRF